MTRRAVLDIRGVEAPEVSLGNPQMTQVIARPVSLGVTPPPTNEALALADALKSMNPALEAWGQRERKKEEFRQGQLGQFEALKDGFRTQAEAMSAVSTDADPAFRRAYMQAQGLAAGARWREESKAFLEAELSRDDVDPTELTARLRAKQQEFIQGLDDPDYLNGFNEHAVATQVQAEAAITEAARKQLRVNSEGALRSSVAALLGESPNPATGWLQEHKDRYSALNLTRAEVENSAWDITSQVALTTLNPALIQEFALKGTDGVPSFAEREPDKYFKVLRMIRDGIANAKQTVDLKEAARAEAGIKADIERLEESGEPVTDEQFQQTMAALDAGVDNGYWKADTWVSTYMRLVAVAQKNAKSSKYAALAGAGTLRAASELSGEERDNALRAYMRPRIAGALETPGISDEDRQALIVQMQTEAALKNRMVYPDHRGVLSAEYLKLPKVLDGKEQMPESWPAAAQLAHGYFKGLQSPGEFVGAFPDQTGKDAAAFYLNYFRELERSPTRDPQAAYLATLRSFRQGTLAGGAGGAPGAAGAVQGDRFSREQAEKLSKKVYSNLTDNRSWTDSLPFIGREGKRGVDNDRVFREWMRGALGRADPNMTDDALTTKLAAEFQAEHMLVGGRWVNSAQLPVKFDRERTVALEQALEALKSVLMLGPQGETWTAKAGGDWKKADLYLSPVPVETQPEVKYEVIVQGEPTGIRVNLDALVRQYDARSKTLSGDPKAWGELLAKHRAEYDAFLKMDSSGVAWTPEAEAKYRRHFEQMREAGLLTAEQYKTVEGRLDTLTVRRERMKAEELAKAKTEVSKRDPVAKTMGVPLEPDELAAIKTVPRSGPNPAETLRLFKHYATGTNAQLAAAVTGYALGYSPVRYQNAAGVFVGFGYSLQAPDEKIVEDLLRAGVKPAGSGMKNLGDQKRDIQKMLDAMRTGTFRLTEQQALRLAEIEWGRAEKAAKSAFNTRRFEEKNPELSDATKAYKRMQRESVLSGSKEWGDLPESTRYALTALRRFTKTEKQFLEAVSALERQDLGVVAEHVMQADPANKQAVPALIRLLGGGVDKARSFIHSQFK